MGNVSSNPGGKIIAIITLSFAMMKAAGTIYKYCSSNDKDCGQVQKVSY